MADHSHLLVVVDERVRRGEGRDQFRSLTLVLDGNSPRFPWKPSTTMLISRHTGTTDDSASNRGAHSPILNPTRPPNQSRDNREPPADLRSATAGPHGALGC